MDPHPLAPAAATVESISAFIDRLGRDAFYMQESEHWERMIAMTEEARSLAESIGYRAGIGRALGIRAFLRYVRSDFQAAINDCMDAVEMSAGNDPQAEGRALGTLAMVNWSVGNYEEALRQGDRALELMETAGDEVTLAFGFSSKAGILHSLQQYAEALEWSRRSVELFQKLGDSVGRARALAVLGSIYLALGETGKALELHQQSLELAESIHHRLTLSRALTDMGAVREALGDDERALECHSQALAIRQQDGYRSAASTNLLALGRIYRREGDLTGAVEVLRRGLAIAEELGARPRAAQIHELLAEVYEETGELDSALKHLKAFGALKSGLATDRVMLQHKALALETQLSNAQNQAELEKMATLGKLVAALAHEINSPLGAIRSSADVSARCAEKLASASDARALETLRSNARTIAEAAARIDELVHRLKSFAGIDQAPYTRLDLAEAIENTVALLRPSLENRVEVAIDCELRPKLYVYAAELQQVFMNLLRNAVEAIQGPGRVTIRVSQDADRFQIAFTDSGPGIAADRIPTLFTPNFGSGSGRVKASLSLFTCMNIVRQHGGSICVESMLGQGSTFMILLPCRLENADPGLEARR